MTMKKTIRVTPNMAKTAATKKTKAAASALKKAGAKTTGEEVINIDTPPKKKQHAANQAAAYFSTTTLKGYTVNPYSKGSKNMINIVFHKGGVPPESRKLVMSLNLGGKALQVEWKAAKSLYPDEQATCQGIQVDSACYHGYTDTMDSMYRSGMTAIDGYHRGAPQVISLDQECTGTPKTRCWSILTDNEVFWEGRMHRQFNSMYVLTLKVAKNRHTIVLGPKFAGIAQFGNIANNRGGGGGGSTSGSGGCGKGK